MGRLTGRSLATGRRQESNPATHRSTQSNRSNCSTLSMQEKKKTDQKMNAPISVDGHTMKVSEFYAMLKTKIIGRHPGGSHGLLKCWSQFRHMAGSGRSGGKGAGFITKAELGVCFRNYGLELDNRYVGPCVVAGVVPKVSDVVPH